MLAIIIIAGVLFGVVAFVFMALLIEWSVHISMVKSNTKYYGRAGHEKFIEEFHKVEWEQLDSFSKSLRGENRNYTDYFHAGIIRLNDRGMIINNPFSLFIVKRYVKRYVENHFEYSRKINEWR